MTESQTKKVNCPTCNTEVAWLEKNTHRPFCSERCKLIDFGDWANERNTIVGDPLYPVDDDDPDPLQ